MSDDSKKEPLEGELLPQKKGQLVLREEEVRPIRIPFFSRKSRKAVEAETALVSAEEKLEEARVRHRRALHQLDNIEAILDTDTVALADDFNSTARRAHLKRLSDDVEEKELLLRAKELDEKISAEKPRHRKPLSKLERLRGELLGDAKLATDLEQEAATEIQKLQRAIEEKAISRERGELQIQNIKDRLVQMLEEL